MTKRHSHSSHHHVGIARFGKDLVRRSSGRCELCGGKSAPMQVIEVVVAAEALADNCLLSCDECSRHLQDLKRNHPRFEADYWHFLSDAVWSPQPPVRLLAVKVLETLPGQAWAQQILQDVDLSLEERYALDSIELEQY